MGGGGGYLEIEALKMKLGTIEKQLQAEHGKYSPTTSHSPYTHTGWLCLSSLTCFPWTSAKTHCEFDLVPCSTYTAASCGLRFDCEFCFLVH